MSYSFISDLFISNVNFVALLEMFVLHDTTFEELTTEELFFKLSSESLYANPNPSVLIPSDKIGSISNKTFFDDSSY